MKKIPISLILLILSTVSLPDLPLQAKVLPANDARPVIDAVIDISPSTVNLESSGNFLTVRIELAKPYSGEVGLIDVASIRLKANDFEVEAIYHSASIGDVDKDGVKDLMVKFDRQQIQEHLFMGVEKLCVYGTVGKAVPATFRGNGYVRVGAKGKTFTILQTSDIHNHANGYGPFIDYTPNDTSDKDTVLGGYARLASLIDSIRAKQEKAGIPVLLVDSGDFLMGTAYDLNTADPVSLRFFNEMNYDAVTLGNHEFDWSPAGLASVFSNALSHGFSVPVLATNTIADGIAGTDDDGIEELQATDVIEDRMTLELSNSLKVGIIGLMGSDADDKAPVAGPVVFDHKPASIQGYVNSLKLNSRADVVIALSHGGIETAGTGDDAHLAEEVGGIDIIASGHFHTATHRPIIKGASNTLIFSPGEYGEWLSRIDITYSETLGRVVGYSFKLIPVNDTVEGDAYIQDMIDESAAAINASLTPLGVSLDSPISATDFPLAKASLRETGIGNLVADSLRAVASGLSLLNGGDACDIAIVASGVIRDDLLPGSTGTITFSDVYSTLPLGISPDIEQRLPGYPLLSIYATPKDIYTICEVALTVAPKMGADYYLNFSGLIIDYDRTYAPWLKGVRSVSVCPANDTFCATAGAEISSADDTSLYRVVVDLYALQMLDVVNGMLAPFGTGITPRDALGNPIDLTDPASYLSHRIDAHQDPGIQELKEWAALLSFLQTAFPESGDGIPESLYGENGSAMGRIRFIGD